MMKLRVILFGLLLLVSDFVYAEQALPPELVLPADDAKNIAKQAIKFSWKKATNAIPAKVYAYRLLISENSRFSGYSASKNTCNQTCIFSEVDSATFDVTTDVTLSNKIYYWKVQAVSDAQNGAWSSTRTIQTKKDIVIPTITNVSVTPNPVIQNNSLAFSATLSNELPPNFSVKVDYGNGLVPMTGTGKTVSLSKTMSKQGVQPFSVGIYDSKNTLQGKTANSEFEVIAPPPPDNTAPILKKVSAADSTILGENYEIELEASDIDNNLSSVLIDWGDGSSNPQPVSNGYASFPISHIYDTAGTFVWSAVATDKKDAKSEIISQKVKISKKPETKMPSILSFSATPASVVTGNPITFSATLSAALPNGYSVKVDYGNGLITLSGSGTNYSVSKTPTKLGQQLFTIGIYDSNSVLQADSKKTSNFSVTEPAPVVIVTPPVDEPVIKTTGYSKIANNGSVLSDSAKLGTAPTDWACTKDNKTGLIWEVKTTDGGLRDWKNTYTWYEPDASKNGGFEGYKNYGSCKGSECDTYAFTNAVNQQGLCGAKDWRMPTIDELKGLLTATNVINQPLNEKLYIDATYFPNTRYWFWSSSPNAYNSSSAWYVDFSDGYSDDYGKYVNYDRVRLVR